MPPLSFDKIRNRTTAWLPLSSSDHTGNLGLCVEHNTGASFRDNDETRIATNTLHLSASRPSHVILPLPTTSGNAEEPSSD